MSESKREFLQFVQDVSVLLKARAGLSYAEVMHSIHPGLDAPRAALENGVSPRDFVEGVIEDEGFMPVGEDVTADEAASFNLAKAAIAGYAFANRHEWHRTADGIYYSEGVEEGQTLFLRPVYSHGLSAYGFGVEIREGAALSGDRTTFVDYGAEGVRFPGPDIADAVGAAREHLRLSSAYSFA